MAAEVVVPYGRQTCAVGTEVVGDRFPHAQARASPVGHCADCGK
jgi:hypothetical protein